MGTPVVVNQINKIETSSVVKLSDGNYQHWRLQITLVLKAAKVWGCVDGTVAQPAVAAPGRDEWNAKDVQAMAIIVTTINQVNANHVSAACRRWAWRSTKQPRSPRLSRRCPTTSIWLSRRPGTA
jgi:hypothetical protein